MQYDSDKSVTITLQELHILVVDSLKTCLSHSNLYLHVKHQR